MWTFIQDQILGMKWLSALIGDLLNKLGLDITGKLGGTRIRALSKNQSKGAKSSPPSIRNHAIS